MTPRPGLMATMCAAVALVIGMVAAVNLAVPRIASSTLHPSASELVWVVDLYVVVFACLVIPGGAVGDRFGRKGVLLGGLGLFAAGALVSAAAPDFAVLLAGRALCGVGAAAVLPNTLAVLLHAVPAERRHATIAIWASMTGIGGVVGNVGGGAVLVGGSWRWLFAAVIPLALALLVLTAWRAPVSERHDRGLDPVGALLLVAASLALLAGIVEGPQRGWANALVIGCLAGSAVLWVVWIAVELRVRRPLIDPRLLRIPALRDACLGMIAVFFGMFALFYVNASFLQYGRGYSTLLTGLGIIPLTVPMIVGARYVGRLVTAVGATSVSAAAFVLIGGSLLGLSGVGRHTGYPVYAGWLLLTGVGVTLALPTLSTAITSSLPKAQAGVGAGLQATTREFGSALGVAVVASTVTGRFASALPASIRAAGHPRTVAAALTSGGREHAGQVIAAFVTAEHLGLRVVAVAVLVAGALITAGSWRSRRGADPRG